MRAVLTTQAITSLWLVSTAFAGDPLPGEIPVDASTVTFVRQDPLSYPRVASSLHWGDVTCRVTVHASSLGNVIWAENEDCPRPFEAELGVVKTWQLEPRDSGVVFTEDLHFDGPGKKNPSATEQALVQAAVVGQPGKHCGIEISVGDRGAVSYFATTDADRCLVLAKKGAFQPVGFFDCEASFASRKGRVQGVYAVPTYLCGKRDLAATRRMVRRWKWADAGIRGDGTRYHVRLFGGHVPVRAPEDEVPLAATTTLDEPRVEDVATTR